jgi:hypothetical protein
MTEQSMNEVPDLSRELLKSTQELANQAALRAQQMFQKSVTNNDQQNVPEVPARSQSKSSPAPAIPPKRLNLKKLTDQDIKENKAIPVPQRKQGQPIAPPIPSKPSSQIQSVQYPPKIATKIQERPPNSPVPLRPNEIAQKLQEKFGNPNGLTFQNPQQLHHQFPATFNNTQIPKFANPSNKAVLRKATSPEELGSEDALRGIESGLRNMERAMQEQISMRNLDAGNSQTRLYDRMEFKNNTTAQGNLDGSQHNFRGMEGLRLNFESQFSNKSRTIERGFSMDHMRMENMHVTLRTMESNPNIRSTIENQLKGMMESSTMRQPENHYRSLDRTLPLELQYTRHRNQEMDFVRHMANINANVNTNNANIVNNRQGMSREDLRIRRRSSHDETQFTQTNPGNKIDRKNIFWCFFFIFFLW